MLELIRNAGIPGSFDGWVQPAQREACGYAVRASNPREFIPVDVQVLIVHETRRSVKSHSCRNDVEEELGK